MVLAPKGITKFGGENFHNSMKQPVAICREQIKKLEKDFDVDWLVRGYRIWCRHCNVGWSAPRKFAPGAILHVLNHLYGHKDRGEKCKCPKGYHDMFENCRGY